jgi:uncharacterized protein YccT (UPF0319 family)
MGTTTGTGRASMYTKDVIVFISEVSIYILKAGKRKRSHFPLPVVTAAAAAAAAETAPVWQLLGEANLVVPITNQPISRYGRLYWYSI